MNKTYGSKVFYKKPAFIIAAAIILVLIIFFTAYSPFVTIPTGHTGVGTTFGKVEDYVLGEGFHIKNPIQEVVLMDNRTQKERVVMQAFSKDIQQVDVICTINYEVDQATAQDLYRRVGNDYYNKVMNGRIHESVKSVFTKYTAEDIMGVRDQLSEEVRIKLAPELKAYGIQLGMVSIEDVDFTDAFTDAVEAKQVAEQKKLKTETEQKELEAVAESTAARELITAKNQAEVRKLLAEAEKEAAQYQADADAYAIKAESEARAAANELIAKSLTEELIKYTEATNWNGELPQIVGGNTALPIVDVTGTIE